MTAGVGHLRGHVVIGDRGSGIGGRLRKGLCPTRWLVVGLGFWETMLEPAGDLVVPGGFQFGVGPDV